ncbi:MAG: ROK family protein [Bacillota bacterium]|nr:ROK family protein [Bacillota bacterium]
MLQSDIKNMNKRIVFDLYREHLELTRVEVSKMSGISMPSVIKAVKSLVDSGILLEMGARQTAVGRKPLDLRFNPDAISAFGVSYEGDRFSIGLVKIDGTIEARREVRLSQVSVKSVVKLLVDSIHSITEQVDMTNRQIAGIGAGIPGVVEPKEKKISFAPLIGVEEPVDLSALMNQIQQETGYPVYIDNDANVMALGEMLARRVQHHERNDDLMYINHGTGLGAGMILDGDVRHGSQNLCGEIGYYITSADAKAVRTESGWLERQVNIQALSEKFNFDDTNPSSQDEVIEHIVRHLTPAIGNVMMLMDIDLVVYGGLIPEALGEPLIKRMNEAVNHVSFKPVRIEAQLSDEPGIVGAAALVINYKLDELV